jgi:hypothetical protein
MVALAKGFFSLSFSMEIFCDSSLYTAALSTPAYACHDDDYKPRDDANGRAKKQVKNYFSQLITPLGESGLRLTLPAHNTRNRTSLLYVGDRGNPEEPLRQQPARQKSAYKNRLTCSKSQIGTENF